MGSICNRYMYIVLYIYIYICNVFGVLVFQRAMLNWRRGGASICHRYMSIVLYIKHIWCNGFAEIYEMYLV